MWQKDEPPTFGLLQGRRQQLEYPSHSTDILDDATSDEDSTGLDSGRKDLWCRVRGERWRKRGSDRCLMLLKQ